jgi:pimeloyl-ACP methyl ester carboxylesterase
MRIVLLHGLLTDHRLWRKVTPLLDGIETFAPTLPRLAGDFPHARIEWIDDSLTFVPEDRPDALAAILRAAAPGSSQ